MDKSKLRGVIFDMDNTLFDFVEAKMIACTSVVNHINAGDPEELFSYFRRDKYGFENLENISDYLNDYNLYSREEFIQCCGIYKREKVNNIKLYPEVRNTMLKLKNMGLILGLLTDADMENTVSRIKKVRLCKCFKFFFTHDKTGEKKPSHIPFNYALNSMNLQPHEILFVGDSLRRDIIPSKQIGMTTAYAKYGDKNSARDRVQTDEPDFVLNDFKHIIDIILTENEPRQERI